MKPSAVTSQNLQGKLTIKHEKVNLKRVVDDVIDLCQPLAKRGVKLVNDLRDNMPFVLGDTGRIIQVGGALRCFMQCAGCSMS